ncbi:MAG: amidohydrolase family protein [Leptospirales bacterium]|nr:amidohydrolase family protein [Leptospirales bacterium]
MPRRIFYLPEFAFSLTFLTLIDIHVHLFPPAVFKAIWRFFENQSHGLWNIRYRLSGQAHVQTLRDFGVKKFTGLLYAHKPGLAAYLNDFMFETAAIVPELLPFGTIYAGDGDTAGQARQIFEHYRFLGIKLHPFVSNEQLDDARFFPAYEIMQAMQRVIVCHPASAPVYDSTDGARRIENLLRRFPSLRVVIAHCGAFETKEYLRLADDYEHVYFDTAMNCVHTHVFENNCPGREFFVRYQDRILYGSDFPNIPYDYAEQASAIRALKLGPEIEGKIFETNAMKLLRL